MASEELRATAEQRLEFFVRNPELIALAKGDLYLRKEAAAVFRVPLAVLLYRVIPAWVAGETAEAPSSAPHAEAVAEPQEAMPIPPSPSPPAASPPAGIPGLRDTVVAVVTTLAELGLIQVPGAAAVKPILPAELHPAAAPAVVGNEVVGAWSPPPRPGLEGPRSAVRRAFYDMLSRS